MLSNLKKQCSVCWEAGDGAHFGAEACRACAAFFRRSVALGKNYACRANGSCSIQKNVRCMCRSCRFAKCIAVGMRKSAVQRHRDILNKSFEGNDLDDSLDQTWALQNVGPNEDFGMSVLNKLSENYNVMEAVRRMVHKETGSDVFTKRNPKSLSYSEANKVHLNDVRIVADWISKSFFETQPLQYDQKKLLFKNFYLPFIVLECGYRGCSSDQPHLLILPSGDYIDTDNLETFFGNKEERKQLLTLDEAVRMFVPSFQIYRKNIVDPMRKDNIDSYEFFTLCSLVFWDHGIEGQSEECIKLSRYMRDIVLREVLYYYRNSLKLDDPSMRLANLLVLLPAVQRSVRRFQEDIEITHVFDNSAIERQFYDMVNGRLSDNFFEQDESCTKSEVDSAWDLNRQSPLDRYNTSDSRMLNLPSTSSTSSASSSSF